MELETINKLYLELSQITTATTAREILLQKQLAEAQRDSERLDWLDKHCTGASDSERYLPRKIYWGGGSHRDVRAFIDAAKGEPS